jgi:hypothetical protein
MELLYVYALCFSFLIFVGGLIRMKENKEYKGHFFYIKIYSEKDRVNNKLLVIGLFRKFFKFKFFWYINLKTK